MNRRSVTVGPVRAPRTLTTAKARANETSVTVVVIVENSGGVTGGEGECRERLNCVLPVFDRTLNNCTLLTYLNYWFFYIIG